jgi:hypothetical protein
MNWDALGKFTPLLELRIKDPRDVSALVYSRQVCDGYTKTYLP